MSNNLIDSFWDEHFGVFESDIYEVPSFDQVKTHKPQTLSYEESSDETGDMNVALYDAPDVEDENLIDEQEMANSGIVYEGRKLKSMPVGLIVPNDDNPCDINPLSPEYKALKDSIKENGLIEKPLVTERDGKYKILSGERRFTIWKELGHDSIPVWIVECTDDEAKRIMLDSNLHRLNMSKVELFRAIVLELQLSKGRREAETTSELADKYGLGKRQIQRYKRIYRCLPDCYLRIIGLSLTLDGAYYISQLGLEEDDLRTMCEIVKECNYYVTREEIDLLVESGFDRDSIKRPTLRNKNRRFTISLTLKEVSDIIGDVNVTRGLIKRTILERFRSDR